MQNFNKSYASFGIIRSFRQIRQAFDDRRNATRNMELLLDLVHKQEQRIANCLEAPVENLRILEIGPGQGMERARYFGLKNEVLALDLDVIPTGTNLGDYIRVLKENGPGRFMKTVGRKLIVSKSNDRAWLKAAGVKHMKFPHILYGDICQQAPEINAFDLIMSWSVFEHLPDPEAALNNIIQALKPGGVVYVSLHLFTAYNGHHDIRAFTGFGNELPLWGHLRQATRHQFEPSSILNEWRLDQWRALFNRVTPGYAEFLESYEVPEKYAPQITGELRSELSDYTDEELFTVDAVYLWKKPHKNNFTSPNISAPGLE
jgi:SAM-dependent methyltransferase